MLLCCVSLGGASGCSDEEHALQPPHRGHGKLTTCASALHNLSQPGSPQTQATCSARGVFYQIATCPLLVHPCTGKLLLRVACRRFLTDSVWLQRAAVWKTTEDGVLTPAITEDGAGLAVRLLLSLRTMFMKVSGPQHRIVVVNLYAKAVSSTASRVLEV